MKKLWFEDTTWRTSFPAVTRWFLTKSLAHSGENIRTSWHRESTQNLLPSRASSGLTNRKCSSFKASNTSDMLKNFKWNKLLYLCLVKIQTKNIFSRKKKKTHQSCFTGRYSMSGDLCDDLIFAFFASSYKSQIIDYA